MADLAVAVEEYAARAAAEEQFSGVVLLAHGEEVVFERSYNDACRRFCVPNRMDTRFDIASLGKMFTGVAIGQLAERGLVAFDAPLARYLPNYPASVGERVTIHHLLTHTSGLGSIFAGGWEVGSLARFRTIDEVIPYFRDRPLLFLPGERWEYSNAGYILLGAVIESVSGEAYFEYVHEHIFAPAGMRDTGPYSLDEDVPNLAYAASRLDPFDRIDSEPRWTNVFRHWPVSTPAGCVYSTASDVLRFARALRRGRLVGAAMGALLTAAKVPTGQRAGQGYGYGFYVDDLRGVPAYGHAGTVPGYQAWLDVYPTLDWTVIVLTNFDHPAARDVAWFAREQLTGIG